MEKIGSILCPTMIYSILEPKPDFEAVFYNIE